jgi:hypothetical protein
VNINTFAVPDLENIIIIIWTMISEMGCNLVQYKYNKNR